MEDLFKCLLLYQNPLRQEHEFLAGLIPNFFPAGKFDPNVVERLSGEISVFFAVIFHEEKVHGSYFNNSSTGWKQYFLLLTEREQILYQGIDLISAC